MRKEAQNSMEQLLVELQASVAAPSLSHVSGLPDGSHLKEKIKNAVDTMQRGLVERDTEVRLLLLAALSGEHILFIGPPGTAKSEIGRRLNRLIQGTYFERLLTRFSVPEELFGPLSMRALEEDKYVRQTRGYLPEAEVAFIDEIFKANSAILNTLLTLINERLFDNGSHRVKVPLITMVGASNELPESEELDALYDRFLVRKAVRQVTASGVATMLNMYSTGDQEEEQRGASARAGQAGLLSRENLLTTKASALSSVAVPPSVVQLITDLRTWLQDKMEPPVYVSDRRLVKAMQLLQVAAHCNGRTSLSEYDCLLLQHILWQRPEQADRINDWIMSQLAVDDGLKQVQYLLQGLFNRACRSFHAPDKIRELLLEVTQLKQVLTQRWVQVAGNLEGGFPVVLENLWLGPEDSEALATELAPKLQRTKASVEEVLASVCLLEVALRHSSDPVTLANLMPKNWADFIRNSDMNEVRPLGTTPLRP